MNDTPHTSPSKEYFTRKCTEAVAALKQLGLPVPATLLELDDLRPLALSTWQIANEPVRHGGHRASKLMPHRDFLEAARAEKSDITLQALCDRLSAERGVKADTSMMSRFFRKIGVTFKKRPSSRANRIART
jgi:hypothetical protein